MSGADEAGTRADAELVAAARAGDKEAFAEAVSRHRATALALTSRLLPDPHLALDAVQEAVVVALLSLERLRSADRFGPWLCGIALNVARRWLRDQRAASGAWPGGGQDVAGPEERLEAAEAAALVDEAVAQLAPGQRQAVLLFYWQGLTHAEAAAELGISAGAVKARLHQARAALEPKLSSLVEREEVPVMAQVTEPQWVDVAVGEIRRSEPDDPCRRVHVVLLDEVGGDRRLPIWIGPPEAVHLALNLEVTEMPRPMTYELASSLLGATGSKILEVRITRLAETTYYAVVVVGRAGKAIAEVDARPSDALNLALVAGTPIRVDARILAECGDHRCAWDALAYPTSGAELVAEIRRRQEEMQAALGQEQQGRDQT